MPSVVAQAVPSDVQSTVGSEWRASPRARGRVVCPHVAPPSDEKNCAWRDAPGALEAPMILSVFQTSTRMSDSLRDVVCAPEIRRSAPTVLLGAMASARALGRAAVD